MALASLQPQWMGTTRFILVQWGSLPPIILLFKQAYTYNESNRYKRTTASITLTSSRRTTSGEQMQTSLHNDLPAGDSML